jgi:hypothetical protein
VDALFEGVESVITDEGHLRLFTENRSDLDGLVRLLRERGCMDIRAAMTDAPTDDLFVAALVDPARGRRSGAGARRAAAGRASTRRRRASAGAGAESRPERAARARQGSANEAPP